MTSSRQFVLDLLNDYYSKRFVSSVNYYAYARGYINRGHEVVLCVRIIDTPIAHVRIELWPFCNIVFKYRDYFADEANKKQLCRCVLPNQSHVLVVFEVNDTIQTFEITPEDLTMIA